jgi:hypothetical protein
MSSLFLEPSVTAQWHALVNDAQAECEHHLAEDLESYLVFLLMRFAERSDLASQIMAMEFMKGLQASGQARSVQLRDVGDQCLLFSGLFPKLASRRRVKISYFVDIGRAAYAELSTAHIESLAEIYSKLASDFVTVMDVLQAIRSMSSINPVLAPLEASELWSDTGSKSAWQSIQQLTDALPVTPHNENKH